MLNKVEIIGHLGGDPESKTVGDSVVANFTVATSDRWKDKNTGEMKEATEWHRVSFWGPKAETAARYLKKGARVYVEGKLQTRKWQDKDGNDRYTTEVRGMNFLFLDRRPEGEASAPAPARSQTAGTASQEAPPFEDDIPF